MKRANATGGKVWLVFLFSLCMARNGFACMIGTMDVAPDPSAYSCQKMNLVAAKPPVVAGSEDCPMGSIELGSAGGGACMKRIAGHNEMVLKAGERCAPGYARFIDPDGDAACRLHRKQAKAADGF